MPKVFSWRIDSQNYLPNKNKRGCKLPFKDFVQIAQQLDSYESEVWENIRNKPNCHSCIDLSRKASPKAKRLAKHLEKVNVQKAEEKNLEIEPFQIKVKSFTDKPEFRVFGYIMSSTFFLVYLDPDHEVYK